MRGASLRLRWSRRATIFMQQTVCRLQVLTITIWNETNPSQFHRASLIIPSQVSISGNVKHDIPVSIYALPFSTRAGCWCPFTATPSILIILERLRQSTRIDRLCAFLCSLVIPRIVREVHCALRRHAWWRLRSRW
jgi:hypothetical protein